MPNTQIFSTITGHKVIAVIDNTKAIMEFNHDLMPIGVKFDSNASEMLNNITEYFSECFCSVVDSFNELSLDKVLMINKLCKY